MKAERSAKIRAEARLLFTLLDATDDAGRLNRMASVRWEEAKSRIVHGASYESQAEALHTLLSDLDSKGTFAGTWIEKRWQDIEFRVGRN